jgi:DNA-binding NarL/FixJ family response regulator
MTNREVAATLFVTVRAVESTLTKVYVKLGVRSLAARRALPRLRVEPAPGRPRCLKTTGLA